MAKVIFKTFFLCLAVAIHCQAQNLVPNPSFETYSICPDASSQLSYATPWTGVTTNSSDYYNACDTGTMNVPYGGGGYQHARTGTAYAGLWAINPFGFDYREYLQAALINPLEVDSCYIVEFYCNLNNVSRYGVNKLGAYISNSPISTVGPGLVLQYIPHIESSFFIDDTLAWAKISGVYHASGGEQYITIGNFRSDTLTDTVHVGGSYPGAYYLLDDIRVEKIPGCDISGISEVQNQSVFSLYPNPNNGNMTLNYTLSNSELGLVKLLNNSGQVIKIINLNASGNKVNIDAANLENGVYLCQVLVNNALRIVEKVIIIR